MGDFDEVTRFRLLNAFIFAIGINLIAPSIIDLKGEFLTAWAISLFLIGEQIVVRTNAYFVDNYSMSLLYKIGIFLHFLLIGSAMLFFINPLYMIIAEGIVYICSVAIFGAINIKLTNYLVSKHPTKMSSFQIASNKTWANGLLIGLCFAICITYFFTNGAAIAAFIIWDTCYVIHMIMNWNFYENR